MQRLTLLPRRATAAVRVSGSDFRVPPRLLQDQISSCLSGSKKTVLRPLPALRLWCLISFSPEPPIIVLTRFKAAGEQRAVADNCGSAVVFAAADAVTAAAGAVVSVRALVLLLWLLLLLRLRRTLERCGVCTGCLVEVGLLNTRTGLSVAATANSSASTTIQESEANDACLDSVASKQTVNQAYNSPASFSDLVRVYARPLGLSSLETRELEK